MPDRRDWLMILGGIAFIVLAFWALPPVVCPSDWVLAGPLKWLLFC